MKNEAVETELYLSHKIAAQRRFLAGFESYPECECRGCERFAAYSASAKKSSFLALQERRKRIEVASAIYEQAQQSDDPRAGN